MSWDQLSPLTLDLLLCGGILLLLIADMVLLQLGRGMAYLAAGILLGILVISFLVDTDGIAIGGAYVGGAGPLFFKRTFLLAGLIACLGSADHVAERYFRRQGEYYLLLLFSLLGMMLLPGAQDLILLVVCFELMSIPLYVLAAFGKNDRLGSDDSPQTPEGSIKLYLVGVTSSAITLFGLSLLYGMAQSTHISALSLQDASPLGLLGMLMVLAGLGYKIGAVPFHMWVPDTYQGAGTPFVSFLSVAPKLAGFAVLALIFFLGLSQFQSEWLPLMVALSVVTMLLGNLLAITQSNVKRLLAFSGVAQIGYMMMAMACGSPDGLSALLFYAVGYTASNMGAFLVLQALSANAGDDSLGSFDGLAQRAPGLALAMLIFLLSLAGIPFVVGFWSKLYVFVAAWRAGLEWMVVLGAVFAVVALYYYLQVARAMYMNPPASNEKVSVGGSLRAAILLCVILVVGLGAWPRPLVEAADRAIGKGDGAWLASTESPQPDSAQNPWIAQQSSARNP